MDVKRVSRGSECYPAAIFLVYLVMASQFESLLHPFIILFTIPLGIVGAVAALIATGTTISVSAVEVASGSADLSQRTEEQAANLQETAASMADLSGTVNRNTGAARKAAAFRSPRHRRRRNGAARRGARTPSA